MGAPKAYTEQDIADTLRRSGVSAKASVRHSPDGFSIRPRGFTARQAAATRRTLRRVFANASNVTIAAGFDRIDL